MKIDELGWPKQPDRWLSFSPFIEVHCRYPQLLRKGNRDGQERIIRSRSFPIEKRINRRGSCEDGWTGTGIQLATMCKGHWRLVRRRRSCIVYYVHLINYQAHPITPKYSFSYSPQQRAVIPAASAHLSAQTRLQTPRQAFVLYPNPNILPHPG